jgi:hypothetical protein
MDEKIDRAKMLDARPQPKMSGFLKKLSPEEAEAREQRQKERERRDKEQQLVGQLVGPLGVDEAPAFLGDEPPDPYASMSALEIASAAAEKMGEMSEAQIAAAVMGPRKQRGRKKKAVAAAPVAAAPVEGDVEGDAEGDAPTAKRKVGRPKGSKNRPKEAQPEQPEQPEQQKKKKKKKAAPPPSSSEEESESSEESE